MRIWKCLGEYDAEGTSYSALAGGAGSSPHSPQIDGRIKALRTIVGGDAVTSLTEHVEFKLSCPLWPVDVEVGAQGAGLRTAPAFPDVGMTWPVDLPYGKGSDIAIEAKDVTADTPVTNCVLIYALIEFNPPSAR